MNKLSVIWVLAIAALVVGMRVYWPGGRQTEAQVRSVSIQGSVESVNMRTQRIVVLQADGVLKVAFFDPATEIFFDGRSGAMKDLKVGQAVNVQLVDPNGQGSITLIQVAL